MEESFELRLKDFVANEAGSVAVIDDVESHFGYSLPEQYKRFMAACDGGEGFIGEQYLILWRANELAGFNRDYEADKYASGLLLFGSNGGGEAFAFDTRKGSTPIVMVPFIGMRLDDAVLISETFENFFSRLADGTLL